MPTYTFPSNSFVQVASTVEDTCHMSISLCLPVYDSNDVAFQFKDNTPGAETYKVGIFVDGSLVGSYANMYKVDLGSGMNLVHMPSLPSVASLEDGQCFQLRVQVQIKDVGAINLFSTNCFYKLGNKCWTSRITYRCDEDSFGFTYSEDYNDAGGRQTMYNRIRLPFHLKKPQYPVKRNVFMKSNGERKKLSARISNEYEVETDYMHKGWHEKLVVALEHDYLAIENIDSGYTNQRFSMEAAYEINWQDFLLYPTAPAKFKLFKTPYYNTNTNC